VRGNRERDVITWYRTRWGWVLAIQGRQLWLSFAFCLQHANAISEQENVLIGRGGPGLPARNW
jgi:hypothetical protein